MFIQYLFSLDPSDIITSIPSKSPLITGEVIVVEFLTDKIEQPLTSQTLNEVKSW